MASIFAFIMAIAITLSMRELQKENNA